MNRLLSALALLLSASIAFAQGFPFPGPGVKGYAGGGGDPSWTSVTALWVNDNAVNGTTTFVDQAATPLTITRGGNTVYSNTSPPTGLTTTAAFDGAGDTLDATSTSAVNFGTGDFTVEMMVKFTNFSSAPILVDMRTTDPEVAVAIYCGVDGIPHYYVNGTDQISGTALSTATWYHIAISRVSGTTRMFVAGTQAGSNYTDGNSFPSAPIRLGAAVASEGGEDLAGNIASFRVTKGVGRYSSGFTPPTLPVPHS